MSLNAGKKFGRYEIQSLIGAGGMGEVFLAEDGKLDRRVALKILPEDLANDAERMRRFVQEAKSASALNHPNIITIYEIGETDDTHFIAAEYIEGENLHQCLKSAPLSLKSALDIAIQIASALQAAHNAGIVHRDIKPENVMIRPDGLVKLLDFGIAKFPQKQSPHNSDSEAATAIKAGTKPGTILGTANYMSPEQARGKQIDARTDVFSFGVVLYEMLAGKPPFEGENAVDVIASILREEPPPLSRAAPKAPPLEHIVEKCLRKDRDERFQTVKDLLIDLKDVRQELEFQNKLERTAAPHREESKTQILSAATNDAAQTTTGAEYVVTEGNRHKSGFLIALSILLLALISFGFWLFSNRVADTKQIESIAVLPFVNESGSTETEYLSDGMTETLISSLSQLPNLKVKARSSVFRYKGKETNAQTVGRELNVQAILTGRVVERGQDLILYVELVDAQTENVLWKGDYRQPMANLASLQGEIARDVSNKLRAKLSGADEKRLKRNQTENPEAYQLYLLGRYHLNKLTDDGFRKGREYFQQAIEKDPNYAPAYAGLADAYNRLSGYNALSPNEGYPKARTAAVKALELDDQLAEAHAVLGAVKHFYDWDWSGAEKQFKRAIEINPNNADARQFYSYHLSAMGRFDESLAEMKRSQELDPLSLEKIAGIGEVLYFQRQFDQAIEHYRKALDMDSNSGFTHWAIGNVYAQKGMYEEAIAEYQKAIPLSGDSPDEPASLAYTYALSGRRQEALRILDDLKQRSKRSYISPVTIAFIYVGLGDKDQAFEWLEKAYSGRDSILVLLNVEPIFDPLRSDPRFSNLLRRVGFEK